MIRRQNLVVFLGLLLVVPAVAFAAMLGLVVYKGHAYDALLRRIEHRIDSLREHRPANISPENWQAAVYWAGSAFGNLPLGDIHNRAPLEHFAAGLDEKIAAGDSLATVRWIWDELERKTKYGAQYAAVYKPLRAMTPGPINDGTLGEIWYLRSCRSLDLSDTQVGDAGLHHLTEARNLTSLNLANTGVTDSGLVRVAELSQLEWLSLKDCRITGAGLTALKRMKALKSLDLEGTGIADAHLADLTGLPSLEHLVLARTGITDNGLTHLSHLTELTGLDLSGTRVSDHGLGCLNALTKLRRLWLPKGISDGGQIQQLRRAIPKCEVLRGPPS